MQAVIFHSKQVLVHFEYFSCNLQQIFLFVLFYKWRKNMHFSSENKCFSDISSEEGKLNFWSH